MRILQALSAGRIGGTELMVRQLIRGLEPSQFECEVSLLDDDGPVSREFQRSGVIVHRLGGAGGYAAAFHRFHRLLASRRYDIVHLYGFRVSLLGRAAAHLVRSRPRVVHGIRGLHVTEGEEPDSLRTRAAIFLEAVGSGLVDLYVANSNAAVEFLARGGVPRAKFVVIPNGIDSTLWASKGVHREASRIVCVANFRPIKRLPDVVDAVAVLKARGVHATCVFVGDGPLRSAVQAQARSAGVDDRIEFMGQQPPEDVAALLDGAGVFVLASLWEGMPVSVMEAMSMGLPVVATDVPGIQELVVQGETGWLVPSRNPEQLADGLMSALANPEKARRMGQAGRVRVEKIFSLDRMIDRHAATYRSLVGGES